MILGALALAACPEDPQPEPPTPGLDPVERRAAFVWSIGDPATLDADADTAIRALMPSGVLASGDAAPDLGADPATGPAADVLAWAMGVSAEIPLSLGASIAPLPDVLPTACFDPTDPDGDPALAAQRDGLIAFLEAWPDLVDVLIDPGAGAPYWDVSCTCTPCDGVDAAALGDRFEVLWTLLRPEIVARQRLEWWWHNAPDAVAATSTLDPTLPRLSLDSALDDGIADVQIPVRARATRGVDSVWAPIDDRLEDGAVRQVAGSLDLAVSRHGPTDAVLIDAADLQDRMRRERARGVTAWFAAVDGPGRRAHGSLEEGAAVVAHGIFRTFGAEAYELLQAWTPERFDLTPEGTAATVLATALGDSGRALDLATHPLGVAVADLASGTPGALPLTYADPSLHDPAWAERVARLASPDLQTIIDTHQWVMEGSIASSEALNNVNTAAADLGAADEQLLRRRFRTLDFAVRAWGRIVLADVTLRALGQGLDEPLLTAWLADDAAALVSLADDIDAALAAGEIADARPVVTANLRLIADQLDLAAAGAVAAERGFPVLYRLRHDFTDGRTNYRWGVAPPSIGWVERGSSWPVYDDESDTGDGPATWWTAWQNGLAADTRVTWRACAESDDGVRVCSSDRVLWTPP